MKYDIEVLKRKMLVKYPFFGSVVANVDYKENKEIPTACTDGKTIYYNIDFLNSLTVEQQTFALAHEVCHIAFNHILRSEGKDYYVWNIATDAVINAFLKRDGMKLIDGVVDIAEATDYDAEELYKKLLEEKKQQEVKQLQQQNGQSGVTRAEQNEQDEHKKTKKDAEFNPHRMWEDSIKKHHKEQNNIKKEDKTEVEKKQEELEGMGEKDAFKKNLEDKKKQLEELKEAISKQASQAGTSTNGDVRTVTDIGRAKPIIDWRYVLREAIKYDLDWSYKNATIEDGVISANLEEQPMPETEIVLDTSGSINEVLLKNFLRECKNILQHTKLKVGCFDTKFYGFQDIRTEEDIENMMFVGGGGTNFDVAVRAFSRRVENKIIFTDGKAPMPITPLDAIWIVFGGKQINPKGGKVILIDDEQLDRLYSYQHDSSYKGKRR